MGGTRPYIIAGPELLDLLQPLEVFSAVCVSKDVRTCCKYSFPEERYARVDKVANTLRYGYYIH
jgi:hypothetical protein